MVPSISSAIRTWEGYTGKTSVHVMKGQNMRTDMFSALEAEVEDQADLYTSLNEDLLAMLKIYDKVSRVVGSVSTSSVYVSEWMFNWVVIVVVQVLVCGQSLSHGVNFTVRDLVKNWSKDMSKIVVLRDGLFPLTVFFTILMSVRTNRLQRRSSFRGYRV